jgi:hypothetical protein
LFVAIAGEPCRAQDAADVAKVIVPFVEKHCVDCHGEKKQKGDLSLHLFKDEAAILKGRKTWNRVLEQLATGEMPPSKRPKPAFNEAEFAVLERARGRRVVRGRGVRVRRAVGRRTVVRATVGRRKRVQHRAQRAAAAADGSLCSADGSLCSAVQR